MDHDSTLMKGQYPNCGHVYSYAHASLSVLAESELAGATNLVRVGP